MFFWVMSMMTGRMSLRRKMCIRDRYYGGEYLYQGRHYVQDQHGFARDYELERMEESGNSVTHRFVSNEETRKVYPFDFELLITHRLTGAEVEIQWQIKNTGDHEMYFTIGGHPGFNVPVLPGTAYSDYALKFADDQNELKYIHIEMCIRDRDKIIAKAFVMYWPSLKWLG